MKLVLQRQDFIRLLFLSKKINTKMIGEPGLEANKVLYYKFLVRYHVQEKDLISAAKAYQIIYDALNAASKDETLIAALDPTQSDRKSSFRNFVLYLIVSGYTDEKVTLLNKIEKDYARELENEPVIAKFVKKLLTYELMPMDEKEIESQLINFEPF